MAGNFTFGQNMKEVFGDAGTDVQNVLAGFTTSAQNVLGSTMHGYTPRWYTPRVGPSEVRRQQGLVKPGPAAPATPATPAMPSTDVLLAGSEGAVRKAAADNRFYIPEYAGRDAAPAQSAVQPQAAPAAQLPAGVSEVKLPAHPDLSAGAKPFSFVDQLRTLQEVDPEKYGGRKSIGDMSVGDAFAAALQNKLQARADVANNQRAQLALTAQTSAADQAIRLRGQDVDARGQDVSLRGHELQAQTSRELHQKTPDELEYTRALARAANQQADSQAAASYEAQQIVALKKQLEDQSLPPEVRAKRAAVLEALESRKQNMEIAKIQAAAQAKAQAEYAALTGLTQ